MGKTLGNTIRLLLSFSIMIFLFVASVQAECNSKSFECFLRLKRDISIYNGENRKDLSIYIFALKISNNSLWNESDETLIIKDKNEKILLRISYVLSKNEVRKFYIFEKVLSKTNNALLLMTNRLPSAPGVGIVGQFYSVNRFGKFVPITGKIPASFDSIEPDLFTVNEKNVKGKIEQVIEVDFWNGNFFVKYFYPIDFESNQETLSKHYDLNKYPVKINDSYVTKYRSIFLRTEKTIYIYPKPGASKESRKRVKINKISKIKFIDASKLDDKWWLHVEINGITGYVTGDRSFTRLGLPAAG